MLNKNGIGSILISLNTSCPFWTYMRCFTSDFLNKEDIDFLAGFSKFYSVRKDPEKATSWREKGNASFKPGTTLLQLCYSQGVCHASLTSDQLALCYANRSAALFHLQHYKECLEDIQRALKHGYPSHLQAKLRGRQTQCLNLLPNPELRAGDQEEGVRSIQKDQNDSVPLSRLSPRVSVCYRPGRGRHLVATEGIKAGELIVEDRAFSCVLIPGMEGGAFKTEERHCHLCLGETVSPVPCGGCSYARYCSEACRRAAWKGHHCWDCPIGAELRATGVMSQLALRVTLEAGLKEVLKAWEMTRTKYKDYEPVTENGNARSKPITEKVRPQEDTGSSGTTLTEPKVSDPSACYHGDSYLSVYHLLPHVDGHTPSLRYLWSVTVATLYLRLRQTGPPPTSWRMAGACEINQLQIEAKEAESVGWVPEHSLLGSVVLRHVLQLRCNAQAVILLRDTGDLTAVQSSEEVRVATAIFPTLSVLNHSCCPNTSLTFRTARSLNTHLESSESSLESTTGSVACSIPLCTRNPVVVSASVRASKDITPGEEVFHCYGPHSSRMELHERRRLLQEQYQFLCVCQACILGQKEEPEVEGSVKTTGTNLLCWKCSSHLKRDTDGRVYCLGGHAVSSSELDHKLEKVKVQLKQALDLMDDFRPDQSVRVLQQAVSEAAVFLADTHPLQGQLADSMAQAYATMGEWDMAATQLQRSVVAISSQYGEDSVELGRQLFKLAQLHFNGGSPGPCLSVMPRARRLLSIHCGPHCPEVQELQAMEDCLQGVL
ncbi:hypothetical protein UPYG_G00127720 [Umbra pygmaea]|uniref:Protein-lysine N-methyltransferase SMYD4 n=1 Tax=Umbra pygmaea TaxID=75934 RepID=A0ABD0X6G0_UMBPY